MRNAPRLVWPAKAARIPEVPTEDCCFAQLLNPRGLEVDYFVSHWWGHPFEQTVNALSNFAEAACEDLEKRSQKIRMVTEG